MDRNIERLRGAIELSSNFIERLDAMIERLRRFIEHAEEFTAQ